MAPALTAQKLGMTPRILLGCCFEGSTVCSPGLASGLLWSPAPVGAGCGFCWLCSSRHTNSPDSKPTDAAGEPFCWAWAQTAGNASAKPNGSPAASVGLESGEFVCLE